MIVYVSQELNGRKFGGVALAGYDFLEILKNKFENVTVVTVSNYSIQTNDFDFLESSPENTIIMKPSLSKWFHSSRNFLVNSFKFLTSIGQKTKIKIEDYRPVDDNTPDIVFVNSWSSLYQSGKIEGLEKFKKVVYIHGNPESFEWQSESSNKDFVIKEAASYLEEFKYHIYVSSIGLSRWESYLDDFNVFKRYYLPNKADHSQIERLLMNDQFYYRNKLNFQENALNIVVCGSIQKRKAQDILLKIIPSLVDSIDRRIIFHLIGGISVRWGGKAIIDEISNSRYSNNFIIHGHKDNALEYIAAADICLFTSRAEAFPITLLEYMGMKKPIIASDVSGVPEMIKNNSNGFLYSNQDLDHLVSLIQMVQSNPEISSRVASKARLDYLNKFSPLNYYNSCAQILEDILS